MGSTSPNTGYAVPLCSTHIAIATSHIQIHCGEIAPFGRSFFAITASEIIPVKPLSEINNIF